MSRVERIYSGFRLDATFRRAKSAVFIVQRGRYEFSGGAFDGGVEYFEAGPGTVVYGIPRAWRVVSEEPGGCGCCG